MNSKSERDSGLVLFAAIIFLPLLLLSCERPVDTGEADDGIPPSAPSGVEIYYATDGIIAFDWNTNPEVDVSYFLVSRSINDSSHFRTSTPLMDLYFIDRGLSYDSVYYYYINAIDRTGLVSPPSLIVSAKPVNRYKPSTPAGFVVNCNNFDAVRTYLDWNINQEGDISGYAIYRGLTPDFLTDSLSSLCFTGNIGYEDTNDVQIGVRYYYKIFAVDKGGLRSSEPALGDDFPLPKTILVSPSDSQEIRTVPIFKFVSLSGASNYKIGIFTDLQFSNLQVLPVTVGTAADTVSFTPQNYYFEYDKRYYWRIYSYTKSADRPNSVSGIYSFVIRR